MAGIGRLSATQWQREQQTYLLRGDCILGNSPAMPEAIGQFEDGQDQLALGCPSFLEPGVEGELLDLGRIGSCSGEVIDGGRGVGGASPSMPVSMSAWGPLGTIGQ